MQLLLVNVFGAVRKGNLELRTLDRGQETRSVFGRNDSLSQKGILLGEEVRHGLLRVGE